MANLLPELNQARKPVNLLAELQQAQPQADPSFGQQALGALENVGSLISGAVAEPVAGPGSWLHALFLLPGYAQD